MPQILHGYARLTIHQRRYIQESPKSVRRVVGEELGVSVPTIRKRKHKWDLGDRKPGAKEPRVSFEQR